MRFISVALLAGSVGCTLVLQLPAAEAAQTSVKMLYSFGGGTDGAWPYGSLASVKGILYGTTSGGGAYSYGSVFAIDPNSKKIVDTLPYSFCAQKNCTDGSSPLSGLIAIKDTLYGTTQQGGANGSGTAFSLKARTGSEQTIYNFGGTDGANAESGLIKIDGTLYGTTLSGGANGKGTVFSLDPKRGTEQVIYSFCNQTNCADGQSPMASLIDVDGTLFGTTQKGGANGKGTVFSVDPGTGSEKAVYSFCSTTKCADGEYPRSSLLDVNGMLYGTTFGGGTNGYFGTVFVVDPSTGTENVLYSFCKLRNCEDGQFPVAGLTNVNGKLYGTTSYGGATNGGEVFTLDPSTDTLNVVYSFCQQQKCADGGFPEAGLVNVKGTLYGTTRGGGASGNEYGTVFAVINP
jgi:uncharacterized repeat protein (TIGR03803 family)